MNGGKAMLKNCIYFVKRFNKQIIKIGQPQVGKAKIYTSKFHIRYGAPQWCKLQKHMWMTCKWVKQKECFVEKYMLRQNNKTLLKNLIRIF